VLRPYRHHPVPVPALLVLLLVLGMRLAHPGGQDLPAPQRLRPVRRPELAILGEGLRPLLRAAGVEQVEVVGVELADLRVQLGQALLGRRDTGRHGWTPCLPKETPARRFRAGEGNQAVLHGPCSPRQTPARLRSVVENRDRAGPTRTGAGDLEG